jgi:hypothetical protein
MGVVEDGSLRLRQTGYAGLVAGSVPGGSFPPHPRAALQVSFISMAAVPAARIP